MLPELLPKPGGKPRYRLGSRGRGIMGHGWGGQCSGPDKSTGHKPPNLSDPMDEPTSTPVPTPGQPGNAGAFKHGGRAQRRTFGLPKVGEKFQEAYRRVRHFRNVLEAAVEDATGGPPDLGTQAAIDSACHAQLTRLLTARLLRDSPEAEPAQVLTWLQAGAKACRARDEVLATLPGVGRNGFGGGAGEFESVEG